MLRKYTAALCFLAFVFYGCSKKQVPATATTTTNGRVDSQSVKRVSPRVIPVPHVIAVNDKVAKKSVDGRMYYDLNGHRYWRNYNDGKYYLFNRSMFSDSAFKPHRVP